MKRTRDELSGLVNALKIAKENESVKLWLKQVKEFKDSVATGAVMSKTEGEAWKNIGILHGLEIAINLDEVLASNLNLGESKIIK